MEDKPNVTFENRESAHEFVITIKREPAVDDQEGNQEGNQVSNQVSNQASNQVTNQVGVSVQTRTRKKYILSLVEKGALEMTNPDNPTDPNQKYRKKRWQDNFIPL